MNLREDKHWSYGAGIVLLRRARRAALRRLRARSRPTRPRSRWWRSPRSCGESGGDRPVTGEELSVRPEGRGPSPWPAAGRPRGAVARLAREIVRYGLRRPTTSRPTPAKVRALTLEGREGRGREHPRPDKLIWVVVGDRAKIEAGVRELNLGELQVVDADGKVL